MLGITEVLLCTFPMSNRKTPFIILIVWEIVTCDSPTEEEVLSGSTLAWSGSKSAALEEYLENNLVYGFNFFSDSPVGGFHMAFFHKEECESLPLHGLQEEERHQSKEPALLASYSEVFWMSAVGSSALYGGSVRGNYEHPPMPFSVCNTQATFQYSVNAVLREFVAMLWYTWMISWCSAPLKRYLLTAPRTFLITCSSVLNRRNFFCAKQKKCCFDQQTVEFLG